MNNRICDIINTLYSALGTLIGISGFVVFAFIFHNVQAGIWAFLSGVFASMTFLLHILLIRGRITNWYGSEQLRSIAIVGILGFLSGLVALISYIALGVTTNEGFPTLDTLSSNYFIMAIWAGMTMKWGGFLGFFAKSLSRRLMTLHLPLNT